nr:hypothetical protein [Methylocapsa sp. S129]
MLGAFRRTRADKDAAAPLAAAMPDAMADYSRCNPATSALGQREEIFQHPKIIWAYNCGAIGAGLATCLCDKELGDPAFSPVSIDNAANHIFRQPRAPRAKTLFEIDFDQPVEIGPIRIRVDRVKDNVRRCNVHQFIGKNHLNDRRLFSIVIQCKPGDERRRGETIRDDGAVLTMNETIFDYRKDRFDLGRGRSADAAHVVRGPDAGMRLVDDKLGERRVEARIAESAMPRICERNGSS